MEAITKAYLQFTRFKKTLYWDVKRYINRDNLNFDNVISLRDLLIPYKTPITKEEMIENKFQIISKINFSGDLFLRDFEQIYTYKGSLNIVPENAIIYSKINVRHGCIYYHEEGKPFGVSSEYPCYTFDDKIINGKFLHKILRCEAFKKLLNTKTTGISKARVKQDDFLDTQIPLPSLKEQAILVANYLDKIKKAEELQKQADEIEREIEKYLFEELGITQTSKRIASNSLNFVKFKSLEKWGVESNLGTNDSVLNSTIYQNFRLKTLVEINPTTTFPKEDIDISFIPMECISDKYGEVIETRNKKVIESKGYTKFQNGDLIWARITPCMQNGKSAIVNKLTNKLGCGSTEFHVIRNNNTEVYIDYIYHILRLKPVLNMAMSHFTGSAGQQRVPKTFLEDLLIPLPSFKIQKEISDKIYQLKKMTKEYDFKAEQIRIEAEQEFEKEIFK
jgi:type I restriction enzyme S subunit